MTARLRITLAVLLLASGPAGAHSFLTVLIAGELRDAHTVQWRLHLPLDTDGRAGAAHLPLPSDCRRTALDVQRREDALVRTLAWHCEAPLADVPLEVAGLDLRQPEALISLRLPDGRERLTAVSRDAPGFTLDAGGGHAPALRAYLPAGIRHILAGWDHLLFLLGLLLLVARGAGGTRRMLRRAILTVTAFTVAHSLTLSAAVLGWLRLPPRAVEACIALSILLLAVELARGPARATWSHRAPWTLAFGFGLLHGFGFAGALAEMGLPEGRQLLALLGFNLGVEAGQLLFVAAAAGIALLLRPTPARRLQPWGVAALGSLSAYWLIERSAAILAGAA